MRRLARAPAQARKTDFGVYDAATRMLRTMAWPPPQWELARKHAPPAVARAAGRRGRRAAGARAPRAPPRHGGRRRGQARV
jgi:hypothetical protein